MKVFRVKTSRHDSPSTTLSFLKEDSNFCKKLQKVDPIDDPKRHSINKSTHRKWGA